MTAPLLQALPFPQLSACDHGDVTVVSLRGELDFLAVSALQAYLSDARERVRSVVDLTGLAFIDCACLGVLVRHSQEIRARGGSFALAGPQGAVRGVLSITGLITWFEVYDTVGQAIAAGRQSLVLPATPGTVRAALPDVTDVTTASRSSPGTVLTTFLELSAARPSPRQRRQERGAAPSAPAPEQVSSL
jgi:anti-sigma B factor antagonist